MVACWRPARVQIVAWSCLVPYTSVSEELAGGLEEKKAVDQQEQIATSVSRPPPASRMCALTPLMPKEELPASSRRH